MKRRIRFSTTQTILLAFLLAILAGSGLLALPVSTADGQGVPYIDALFTATTSVCVTGLVTLPTVTTWSAFGQAVILLMIQVGGLGVVTVMAGVMLSFHRRIGIGERLLLQDTFNLNTMSGLVTFLKRVLIGTFAVESAGALLYMTVFVPEYGARGIWISVFTSISAFCNAGIDILSENSLCGYVFDPVVNLTTCLLVVLGGIGFLVWWDVLDVLKGLRRHRRRPLSFHSRLALSTTLVLLLAGFVLFFVFEYDNPRTMKDFSLPQKLMASLFQSMTTRTAGFATLPQEDLSSASSLVSLLLMFIGGSPTGTAGGIKTVTFTVLLASTFATVRSREETSLFQRSIPRHTVNKAVAVAGISFMILFAASVLVEAFTGGDVLDVVYETVSATATVGLSRNFTSRLNLMGKLVVILTMYLGRVGPISLFIAFSVRRSRTNLIKNPTEAISVG